MKNLLYLILVLTLVIYSCKSRSREASPSPKSGINTSRSGIKNDVDTTKNKTNNNTEKK